VVWASCLCALGVTLRSGIMYTAVDSIIRWVMEGPNLPEVHLNPYTTQRWTPPAGRQYYMAWEAVRRDRRDTLLSAACWCTRGREGGTCQLLCAH
jgi:hypothetical protein